MSCSPGSTPPRRRRSRARSRTPSRTPSRSRSPTRSRSRSPSRSKSRSRSPSLHGSDDGKKAAWDNNTVEYDDFIPADEESPTFFLSEKTVDLIRTKVYQAPPLGQKYYVDLKKSKYMMARDIHETLEPKPVPAQAVSSVNGMDLNRLHGSMLKLHNISRVSQRPVWALMELLQKTRGNLKNILPLNFSSPPFLTTPSSLLPDGHVELDYPEEERLRHMAKCPQNPSQQEVNDMHQSLGVYKKFHEVSSAAMLSMVSSSQKQQGNFGNIKSTLDVMWGHTVDYINMARFLETHLKEMRRSQLVKQHTKEFVDWLDNIHLKDREQLGARDQSDEILAANYDDVLKQFNEFRKNKNTALKSAHIPKRTAFSGPRKDGHASGSTYKEGHPSGSGYKKDNKRDNSHNSGNNNPPSAGKRQRQQNPQRGGSGYTRKRGSGARGGGPPPKKSDKDKTV